MYEFLHRINVFILYIYSMEVRGTCKLLEKIKDKFPLNSMVDSKTCGFFFGGSIFINSIEKNL